MIVLGVILELLGVIGRPVLGRRHWDPITALDFDSLTSGKRRSDSTSSYFSVPDASYPTQRAEGREPQRIEPAPPDPQLLRRTREYSPKATPRRPPPSRTAVFISYRRAETSLHAELIYKELVALLGADAVFKDVDSLQPGEEFRQVILDRIGSCRIVLVLIGSAWASITDRRGERRLDDPDDPVRIEIETALRYNLIIIPVLCDGILMPSPEELPTGILKLLDRQAYKMSPHAFTSQAQQLAQFVKSKLA